MKFGWARRIFSSSWWLGLAISCWAFLLFAVTPRRGFSGSGVWQIEQADAAASWLSAVFHTGGNLFTPEAWSAAFTTDPRRGPLIGLITAVPWRTLGIVSDSVSASHLANILFVCLTAWCSFAVARRAGGALAGILAAVAMISVPRIWAAASSPGLTAGALCAFTLGACAIDRGRERFRWFFPAVLLLAMALLTTQMALLLLFPWLHLTFFSGRRSGDRGTFEARPLSFWSPLVFPLAILLAFLALAAVPGGTKEQFIYYLKGFVTRPRVETLYFGEVYSNHRLPWHAAPVLVALTVPPTVLFMTIYGLAMASPLATWIRRRLLRHQEDSTSGDAREALRLAWSMLLLTLLMPLLFGTTFSHGVDLLALAVPWCAVFAGVGVASLLTTLALQLHRLLAGHHWARLATLLLVSLLGWSVFVFALRETNRAYPQVESYYSWLVGGVGGAAKLGLPRYPHGPLPPDFLHQATGSTGETRVALLSEPEDTWSVLERYRNHGLIPPGIELVPLQNAQTVILRFNELSGEFYQQLPDFLTAAAAIEPEGASWLMQDGIPLFGAIQLEP
ncbi:MAG: hypothetical protein JW797_07555 [Bradymonadales bacterium]|nr:hypothetical protein [Bradymonadales bacterium]